MAVVDELIIALGVRTDGASFRRASSAIEGVMQGAVNLGAAVGAAVTALFGVAKATADYVDEATDAAAAIGMEAGALVELRWAMARATGSAEGLEGALRILSRTTQDALDGGEASAKAFARLGISVDQLRNKSPDEVLSLVAEGMRGIESPTERTALAMDVLGRSGAALVPMLVEGADGIEAMRQRARDLGVTISEDASQAAGEFNDTLDDLTALGTGLVRKIGMGVIPVFTRWGKKILDLWSANRDFINQRLDLVIDLIVMGLRSLEGPLGVVVGLMSALAAVRAAGSILALAQAIPGLGTAMAGASASMLAFAKPLAAILVLALALDDLFVAAQGGDSFTTRFAKWMGMDDESVQRLRDNIDSVFESIRDVEIGFRRLFGQTGEIATMAPSPRGGPQMVGNMPESPNWIGRLLASRGIVAGALADPSSAGFDPRGFSSVFELTPGMRRIGANLAETPNLLGRLAASRGIVGGALLSQERAERAEYNINVTVPSATNEDITRSVREAIHQAHRESAAQYGAP
jgi:hypothetical protein